MTNTVQPNNKLFVEDISSDVTHEMLTEVFSLYAGFLDVRYFKEKGLAFVEYDQDIQAGQALIALQDYKLTPDTKLKITFAKK